MRCEIIVSAGTYRHPGQCAKTVGLKMVKLHDRRIPVCTIHRKVMEAAKMVKLGKK